MSKSDLPPPPPFGDNWPSPDEPSGEDNDDGPPFNKQALYPFPPSYADNVLAVLADINGYRVNPEIDRKLVENLMRKYPEIEILDEVEAYMWYFAENSKSTGAHRNGIRRWIARAKCYKPTNYS